jgi:hypothetical protein
MEDAAVPYTLKCPAATALFGRCDAVVLYLSSEDWKRSRSDLRAARETVAAFLRPQTPPLALPLAPGVAIAEDPGDSRSFGDTRSRAVADGLLHAFALGLNDADAILGTVLERLSVHGIRPDRPHLRAGSAEGAVEPW